MYLVFALLVLEGSAAHPQTFQALRRLLERGVQVQAGAAGIVARVQVNCGRGSVKAAAWQDRSSLELRVLSRRTSLAVLQILCAKKLSGGSFLDHCARLSAHSVRGQDALQCRLLHEATRIARVGVVACRQDCTRAAFAANPTRSVRFCAAKHQREDIVAATKWDRTIC